MLAPAVAAAAVAPASPRAGRPSAARGRGPVVHVGEGAALLAAGRAADANARRLGELRGGAARARPEGGGPFGAPEEREVVAMDALEVLAAIEEKAAHYRTLPSTSKAQRRAAGRERAARTCTALAAAAELPMDERAGLAAAAELTLDERIALVGPSRSTAAGRANLAAELELHGPAAPSAAGAGAVVAAAGAGAVLGAGAAATPAMLAALAAPVAPAAPALAGEAAAGRQPSVIYDALREAAAAEAGRSDAVLPPGPLGVSVSGQLVGLRRRLRDYLRELAARGDRVYLSRGASGGLYPTARWTVGAVG